MRPVYVDLQMFTPGAMQPDGSTGGTCARRRCAVTCQYGLSLNAIHRLGVTVTAFGGIPRRHRPGRLPGAASG